MLTDREKLTIVNALHIASAVYREDAKKTDNSDLADQFDRQAREAIKLADKLEELS